MNILTHHKPDASSRRQFAAFLVAACIASTLCVSFCGFHFERTGAAGSLIIVERINPNTADLPSLLRLPNIGPKRAQAIIEYRRTAEADVAFSAPHDLENIKGIGPKTVAAMENELCFD